MLALPKVLNPSASFPAFGLAVIMGFASAAGLAACDDSEPAEQCYEELKMNQDNMGLICETDLQDRVALAGGRPSELYSVCVPLEECPEYCPVEDVNQSVIIPDKAADDPDYVIGEIIPLCVELDTGAGNCCFWSLLIEEGDL